MKQIVSFEQAKRLSNAEVNTSARKTKGKHLYPAPTIGELIEWIDSEIIPKYEVYCDKLENG